MGRDPNAGPVQHILRRLGREKRLGRLPHPQPLADLCDETRHVLSLRRRGLVGRRQSFDARKRRRPRDPPPEIFRVAAPGRHEITMQVAEGGLVVSQIVGRGVHKGDLLGIPATNRDVETTGIVIHRVLDGKIVEYIARDNSAARNGSGRC